MKIKDGGQTETLKTKIETIRIYHSTGRRSFELWLNEDSLSYLTMDELLDLRDEINVELRKVIDGVVAG